jgi:hypothetical protein
VHSLLRNVSDDVLHEAEVISFKQWQERRAHGTHNA